MGSWPPLPRSSNVYWKKMRRNAFDERREFRHERHPCHIVRRGLGIGVPCDAFFNLLPEHLEVTQQKLDAVLIDLVI